MKKILVISDLHINSTVALMPPIVYLDDGQEVKQNKGQKWLWNNWLDLLEKVDTIKPDILIVNGDAVEGDTKNRSYQVITRNKTTAVGYAADVLDPLVKSIPSTFFIRGTAAHSGKSGCIEEDLAKDLGAERIGKNYAHWSLNLDVEGVRISVAHHTNMSGLPWTKSNAANSLAAKIQFQYAQDGEKPPELAIRGHVHRWGDSHDAYRVRALVLPCWTLATEYIHKISPDTLAECGAAVIECSAGHYEITKIDYKPKARTWLKI